MLQIAKGIEVLHSQRIIHRDIKAGNVLIKKELTDGNIVIGATKLTDFVLIAEGISILLKQELWSIRHLKCFKAALVVIQEMQIFIVLVLLAEVICGKKPVNKNVEYSKENFTKAVYDNLYDLYQKCTNHDPSSLPVIHDVIKELELLYQKIKLDHLKEKSKQIVSEIVEVWVDFDKCAISSLNAAFLMLRTIHN